MDQENTSVTMDQEDTGVTKSTPFDFGLSHYCAEGVKNDFQKMVDRFLENESIRYEDFVKIWKDMHFYNIFLGRQTRPKLKEFTEECLRLACELWVEAADFQIQVCGLYLLFGLYFCQPIEPKSNIRMTLPMWQGVREFVASVKQYNHLDVEYVYMKLVLSKAFYFVATVSNINEIRTEDHRRRKLLSEGKKIVEHTSIHELTEPDTFLKMEVIDQQYQRMKCSLSGPGSSQPDLSLRVIHTDLPKRIIHDVTTFKSRRLGLVNDDKPADESENESLVTAAKEANLRNEIKQKALSKMAVVRRDRRHRKLSPCQDHVTSQSGTDTYDDENTEIAVDTMNIISMPTIADLVSSETTERIAGKARATKPNRKSTASGSVSAASTRQRKSKTTRLADDDSTEAEDNVTISEPVTLNVSSNAAVPETSDGRKGRSRPKVRRRTKTSNNK